LLAGVLLAASLSLTPAALAAAEVAKDTAAKEAVASAEASAEQKPCRWWQFGCDDKAQVEGLPAGAPREGTVVTVDLSTHTVYLFREGELVRKSLAGTGSDKKLKQGRRIWWFRTPRGKHVVKRKIEDPIWNKPDWAFIEEGKAVPPPNSPKRQVKGKLGKYALDLGDGILIHGTDDPNSFGRKVSHGCIRLPDDMLATLWKEVGVGTEVYIFESTMPEQTASKGLNDLEM
jgi:L,D-transpeptidase YbiS